MKCTNQTAPFFAVEIAKYGLPQSNRKYYVLLSFNSTIFTPVIYRAKGWYTIENNRKIKGLNPTHYFTQAPPKEVVEEYNSNQLKKG